MAYYVTKKRVNEFISSKEHEFRSTNEFITEVDKVLSYLGEYPKDNPNQIRFYEGVKKALKNDK